MSYPRSTSSDVSYRRGVRVAAIALVVAAFVPSSIALAEDATLPAPLAPYARSAPSPPDKRAPSSTKPAPAQSPLARPPDWTWAGMLDIRSAPSFFLFAAGALSSLTLHELGHVFANLAYGNVPSLTGIRYAKFIPWFVVDARLTEKNGVWYKHDGGVFGGGARGYYVINTAGFMVQNIGSEAILSAHPGLLYERAPLLKGMLVMNVALSLGYSTASLIGTEDHHGDIYGAAQHSAFPHQLIAGVVFANGAFDVLRYFFPDSDWLPWVSRTSKAMLLGMEFPLK